MNQGLLVGLIALITGLLMVGVIIAMYMEDEENGERGGSVDVYCVDEGGGYFEDFTWEEVEAWAEMPQPYREEDDDGDCD